jgi:hypothetical protein
LALQHHGVGPHRLIRSGVVGAPQLQRSLVERILFERARRRS